MRTHGNGVIRSVLVIVALATTAVVRAGEGDPSADGAAARAGAEAMLGSLRDEIALSGREADTRHAIVAAVIDRNEEQARGLLGGYLGEHADAKESDKLVCLLERCEFLDRPPEGTGEDGVGAIACRLLDTIRETPAETVLGKSARFHYRPERRRGGNFGAMTPTQAQSLARDLDDSRQEAGARQAALDGVYAVLEGIVAERADDAERLLVGFLETHTWREESRILVERIDGLVQDHFLGDAPRPLGRIARDAMRTIVNTAASAAGRAAWDRIQRSDRYPRFLEAQGVVVHGDPTRLLASGSSSAKRTCRLFRLADPFLEKSRHEWRWRSRDDFRPASFAEEQLIEVDAAVTWENARRGRNPPGGGKAAKESFVAPVPLREGGMYVLLQEEDGFRTLTPIAVVSFTMVARTVSAPGEPALAIVIDRTTDAGIADVEITLRGEARAGPVTIPLGLTDERGLCRFPMPALDGVGACEIEGRRGGERWRLWLDTVGDAFGDDAGNMDGNAGPTAVDEERRVLITTDRPLYRPGQEVRYRAVLRDGRGRMVAEEGATARVEIRDPSGRIRHAADHRWNEFGSLSGAWTPDDDPRLGTYTLSVSVPRPRFENFDGLSMFDHREAWRREAKEPWRRFWSESFTLAAYRKPDAEVRIVAGEKPGTAVVSVGSFVGGRVGGAEVAWSVEERGDGFDGEGERSFEQLAPLDDPRAWFYHRQIAEVERARGSRLEPIAGGRTPPRRRHGGGDAVLASGSGRTDAEGRLVVEWPPRRPHGEPAQDVRVRATVRDDSRLTAEGFADLAVTGEPLRLEVGTDRLFAEPGVPLEVRIRASTPAGDPVTGEEVVVEGILIEHRGGLSPLQKVFVRETLRTDDRGRARSSVVVPAGGRVCWRATMTRAGATIVSRADLWCAGSGMSGFRGTFARGWSLPLIGAPQASDDSEGDEWNDVRARPPGQRRGEAADVAEVVLPPLDGIVITPDRFAYAPGETIRLLVGGEAGPRRVFVGIDTRSSHRVEVVEVGGRGEVIELPVTAEDRGLATVWVVGGQGGEVFSAQRAVFLYPADQALDVRVRADRQEHAPGQKATLTVEVRGSDGAGRRAEVEIAVVDAAVMALLGDRAPHPMVHFHPVQSWVGSLRHVAEHGSSAHVGTSLWAWMTFPPEPGEPDRLGGRSFTGLGAARDDVLFRGNGMMAMAAALPRLAARGAGEESGRASDDDGPLVRERFAETWFWKGDVVTDDAGRADVELDVPDTITRWRVVARAVTRSGESGMGESTALSRRPLFVRLVAPRFLTVGDRTTLSALVESDLERPADVAVRMRADGADLGARTVRVEARGRGRVEWPFDAAGVGPLRLEVEAATDGAADGMALVLPVRDAGHENRLTARGTLDGVWTGTLALAGRLASPDAEVEVVVDTGPLSVLRAALPSLVGYPYGCVEQTMSRFVPVVAAARAMRTTSIPVGALEEQVPAMVEAGVERLMRLEHEGGGWGWWRSDADPFVTAYVIDGLLTAREAGFAIDQGVIERGLRRLRAEPGTPFALSVRARAGDEEARRLIARFAADAIGPQPADGGLAGRGFSSTPGAELALLVLAGRRDLIPLLPVAPPGGGGARTVGSVREAALVIRAIAHHDPHSDLLPPLVEWLIARRSGGAWGDTLETASAVLALCELPLDDAPAPFSVAINGTDVVTEATGRAVVTTRLLHTGENVVTVRGDDPRPLRVDVVARVRGVDPATDVSGNAGLSRRIERLAGGGATAEDRWVEVPSGASVTPRDRVRIVVRFDGRADRLLVEAPLAAGLEPLWRADEAEDRRRPAWAYREAFDDRVCVAYEHAHQEDDCAFEVRPTLPGRYSLAPTVAFEMYAPGRRWATGTMELVVEE